MLRGIVLVVASMLAAATCGGRSELDSGTGMPVPQANFAEAYAAAECSALAGCCAAVGLRPAAGCVSTVAARIQGEVAGAVNAGAVYDATTAGACVAAVGALFAQCTVKLGGYALPDVCSQVFTHKPTPPGGSCASSWQCADGLSARGQCSSFTSATGTTPLACEQIVYVSQGEDCIQKQPPNTRLVCRPPSFCDFGGKRGGVCLPRSQLGQPCLAAVLTGEGDDCDLGLVCDRLGSKVCVSASQPGAPCTIAEQCEGFACGQPRPGSPPVPPRTCQPLVVQWFPFACDGP
jgi:hypothetical protein